MSTNRFKTNRLAVTAPYRLGHRVSRHAPVRRRIAPPHPVHAPNFCKAQTSSSGCPRARTRGTSQIDQGRSLCVHHRGCLRYLMRTSTRWILRSNRYTHAWDLGARATSVHRRTRAHTLVAPTIHLSKSKTSKVLRRLPLQGSSSSDFFPFVARSRPYRPAPFVSGERNLIVRSAPVNRPPRRFLSNLHKPPIDP